MRQLLLRLLFIQYCIVAGVLLITLPWSAGLWERVTFQIGFFPLIDILQTPWARGAVSGFGLVHLVWGAHDLYDLLFHPAAHGEEDPTAPGHQ